MGHPKIVYPGILIIAVILILGHAIIKTSYNVGYNKGYEVAEEVTGKIADFDCYDGCLYADWIMYGFANRTEPSELYDNCTEVCLKGNNYFINIL